MAVKARPGLEDNTLRPYVSRLLATWPDDVPWREIEGTLSFVDISGFTSLTERLAKRGKVGAEELNDILSACFSQLLAVASGYGADLVKWGGDAVLLLFEGDHHPARAVESALAMQSVMGKVGRIRSSAGSAQLRMSIGVHSGRLHFVRAGGNPIDLIPIGPDVTQTVAMETIAEAGEVAVSPETAQRLELAAIDAASERNGALILVRPPMNAGTWGSHGEDEEVRGLGRFLAPAIRDHLMSPHREAEHRQVAVAFLEFGGTDPLLAEHGPDRLAAALDESLNLAQEAAALHGVTYLESDIAKGGLKVLLVAGAPVTAGQDEERMLRAVKLVVDSATALPVRGGVTTGRVFSGDFGPPWRRTFSIKGDAVNLAARIMTRAEHGQVLAANDALERSQRSFAVSPLEPFLVKGKQFPVHASAVGAMLEQAEAGGAPKLPLVGRDREVEILAAALDSARVGTGGAVSVVGEPGSGKSRVVDELVARAGDAAILRVACQEYDAAVPYRPFRLLLRRVLGIPERTDADEAGRRLTAAVTASAPDLVPWLPLLAVPIAAAVPSTPEVDSLSAQFRAERLVEVARLLLAALLTQTSVLVFEDVHWIDAASAELLSALTEAARVLPWLVVVTERAGVGRVAAGTTVELGPLDPQALARLADAAAGDRTLAPHESAALVERSGGNPLFLAQLAQAFVAAGDLDGLPDSVEKLLTSQIDRLNPAERRVLRYSAVIGTTASLRLLRMALVGSDVPLTPQTWHRLRDFITVENGEAHFRSGLLREVAYEGLPFTRRRALHAVVGEAIEQAAVGGPEAAAGILSLHFLYAQRHADAWRYANMAAARALEIYANVEARTLYQRALLAMRRLRGLPAAAVADAWEGLGTAHVRLGEFPEARASFRAARRRSADDPVGSAELHVQEAQTWYWVGNYRPALRALSLGLRQLASETSSEAAAKRARVYLLCAAVRLQQGRSAEAADWCRRAIPEAENAGEPSSLALAYEFLDSALISVGRYDEAVHGRKALEILDGMGQLELQGRILNNLGVAAHVQGRWPEALDFYGRAEDAWARAGNHFVASFPASNTGLILLNQGRLEEAEQILRQCLRVARASRSGMREAPILLYLGMLAMRAERLEEAADLLETARAAFAAEGNAPWMVMTEARLAELHLHGRNPQQALDLAESALAHADATDDLYALRAILHRVRGSALLQLGDLDAASGAADLAIAEARRKRDGYELALALQVRSRLAASRGEDSAGYDAEARALLEQLGVAGLAASA